jgi:hypothetical protein
VFCARHGPRRIQPGHCTVRRVAYPAVLVHFTLLADQIIDNVIDLDPEYQRGESLVLQPWPRSPVILAAFPDIPSCPQMLYGQR